MIDSTAQISVEKAYAAYSNVVSKNGTKSIPFNMFGKVLKQVFNERIVKKKRKLDKENNGGRTCKYSNLPDKFYQKTRAAQ